MKKQTFLLSTLLLLACTLNGQKLENSISNWTVQFTGSYALTYHYNPPKQMLLCVEGCTSVKQSPRMGNNLQFSINRKVNRKGSINIGIGLATIQFYDKSSADWFLGHKERIVRNEYYNLQLGYRYMPYRKKSLNFFIENKILIESMESNDFDFISASYQMLAGFIFDWSSSLKLISSPFFKSAFLNYDKAKGKFPFSNKGYFPYSFGIDMGFLINLNKQAG